MAEFSVIEADQAPAPPSAPSSRDRQVAFERCVVALRRGAIGRVEPEHGQTARGVLVQLGQAARRMGLFIEVWVEGGSVCFRLY